ncbi:hypothetical protein [uncultured Draconibacterium sp.]|uniref:hypothetical protein n=1 Tax=uncultured Draconibacterium sp. TaxID=1573823 RepID=UPI002AA72B4B|nr:hypothetical protein [uncultured Draconibacterium sp.]
MKTKINLLKCLSLIMIGIGIILSSCLKNELPAVEDSSQTTLKSAGMGVCDLIAGQYMYAGMISYTIEGDQITVHYTTYDEWAIQEVHLYVGPIADLPKNKKAIKLGQFPVSEDNLGGLTSVSFSLPFDDTWTEPIIAAQAVVYSPDEGTQTAWGKCCNEKDFVVKVYYQDASGQINHAVSEGNLLFPTANSWQWCSLMGSIALVPGTYHLINPELEIIGEIRLYEDGILDILPVGQNTICNSYVFVGNVTELMLGADDCPTFYNFPYAIEDICDAPHQYSLELSEENSCISFEEAFGSKKWGWFSFL